MGWDGKEGVRRKRGGESDGSSRWSGGCRGRRGGGSGGAGEDEGGCPGEFLTDSLNGFFGLGGVGGSEGAEVLEENLSHFYVAEGAVGGFGGDFEMIDEGFEGVGVYVWH